MNVDDPLAGAVQRKDTWLLALLLVCVSPPLQDPMARVLPALTAARGDLALLKDVGVPTKTPATKPVNAGVVPPPAGASLNVYVAPGTQPREGKTTAPALSAGGPGGKRKAGT